MNILFIPGIKGSELYLGESRKWFPNNEEDLKSLEIHNELKEGGVLSSVNAFVYFKKEIYKGLLDSFNPEEFDYFSYDWRQSLLSHVDNLVGRIMRASTNQQVTLVAHSMGGILGKLALLEIDKLGLSNRVSKFITIGTPWHGSADAYKALAYGEPGFFEEFMPIFTVFDYKKTRKLARQFPSVYQLLPSEEYFNSENGKFLSTDDDTDYVYIDILSKVQRFFNAELVDKEKRDIDVYRQYMKPIQDAMLKDISIPHYCLIGHKILTLTQLPESAPQVRKKFKKQSQFSNGDGVVPIWSAVPSHSNAQIYYAHGEHSSLCSLKSVINFIRWAASGMGEMPESILTEVDDELKGGRLSRFLCPINTTILDEDGRYIAGAFNTDITEISPLASNKDVVYHTIGESKYLYIPEEIDTDLTVKVNSYEVGVADISVQYLETGTIQELHFDPLPVDKGVVAEVHIPVKKRAKEAYIVSTEKKLMPIIKEVDISQEQEINNKPTPNLKILISSLNEYQKASRRPVYSGGIKVTINSDSELIESVYYSIDGSIPQSYLEPVDIILPSGSHKLQAFGKDRFGRPTNTAQTELIIDDEKPQTKINIIINPEGFDITFDVYTLGTKAKTFYKIQSQEEKEWHNEQLFYSWDELNKNKDAFHELMYYSISEFDIEEEHNYLRLSLGNLPNLMWEDDISVQLIPEVILHNILKHNNIVFDDFTVTQLGRSHISSTFNDTIRDDVKGVRFESERFKIDVMFGEKYGLYFVDFPTEVLQVGKKYKYAFELIAERSKERIVNSKPSAKIKADRKAQLPDKQLELYLHGDTFHGEFTVDETFVKYKHKLVIVDHKNSTPALREIPLIMKEE